ncbi:alpha/beta fold hydrolase, partial [Zoogloea sp.]
MLHGWMDVSASFQFIVDALASDWHVIAPDWRGFGRTEWRGDAYWFPDYLGDLDAILDL